MSGIMLAHRAAFHGGKPMPPGNPAIGDAYLGGYYAGIIDTTVGNIIASDASQTGSRFALIVAPKTLENSSQSWGPTAASVAAARTLWNGLAATTALNSSTYPAAFYCAGLTKPTGDSASAWYLPALDELELVWRNLKPITNNNAAGTATGTFPPYAHASGINPSSDPTGAAYTTTVPAQTSVAAFKSGGAQALTGTVYWTATEVDASNAWIQYFGATTTGNQDLNGKQYSPAVRPVRRLVLA